MEPGDWYEVIGGNPTVDLNIFDSHAAHVLRPPNIEYGEIELNIIANKHKEKSKFILNNALGYKNRNKILVVIKEIDLPITGKLYDRT